MHSDKKGRTGNPQFDCKIQENILYLIILCASAR